MCAFSTLILLVGSCDLYRRPYNLYCVGGDVKPCSINRTFFGGSWFLPYSLAVLVKRCVMSPCFEWVLALARRGIYYAKFSSYFVM